MVNRFKESFVSHGQVVYENPSPGNKAGGITTLADDMIANTAACLPAGWKESSGRGKRPV